jgi:hypothetical protein
MPCNLADMYKSFIETYRKTRKASSIIRKSEEWIFKNNFTLEFLIQITLAPFNTRPCDKPSLLFLVTQIHKVQQ